MKTLSVLWLCALSNLLAQSTSRTFTSPDGAFEFKYSPTLVNCLAGQKKSRSTTSGVLKERHGFSLPESCMSQGGMCGDSGAQTIACYAYPKDEFKEKPTFTAAAFFVAEVEEATTKALCLKASRYWNVESTNNTSTESINRIQFKVFEISDVGAGSGQGGPVYRAFHKHRCYELSIQRAFASSGVFDPGTFEEFTRQDEDKVQSRLKQPLESFKFLK